MAYIKVALSHESPVMFIQIEQDGKISKETFMSVFPRAHGMFFHHKNNQYVITLINDRFHPPPDGWRNTVFYPLFDDFDDDDYYENDDEYETDDDCQDDGYYQDDGYVNDKTSVGVKPPQKEDINELYYKFLRNNDDDYDDFDDDE